MSCGDAAFPVRFVGKHGRTVQWAASGYEEHVSKRPYLSDHAAIREAVLNPILEADAGDGARHYYGAPGLLPPPYASLYLFVAVWWQGHIGNIATAFVVKKVRSY